MRELANVNYQKELEKLIEGQQKAGRVPRLFLHACCAPCSSYVLEYLSRFFSVTVFFYNPNISPKEEYEKRVSEIQRLISEMEFVHPVAFVEGEYKPEDFYEMARGLEDVPEGGERCFRCYRLRMEEAARLAEQGGYDYFTTTLSISPLKNAGKINGRITAAVYFPNGRAWKSSDKGKKRKNANVALKCSKVEETWKFSLQFR